MSNEYCHQVLKVCVAQICQNLGWTSTQATPLEILTDILERYLLEVGKVTHRYTEQFGRTEPTVDDIGLAFRHLNVSPSELREFIENTDPFPYAHDVVAFPAPKKVNLQFPKPECREVVTRDEYIPEYMPLLHPELEEEETTVSSTPNNDIGIMGMLQLPTVTPLATSPTPEGVTGEKPTNTPPDGPPFKRRRLDSGALPEEAGPSLYEMKSIIISNSGDLTPTHGKAGKLPDPRTPPQGYQKKKESPKPSPLKIPKKTFEKSDKEKIERDLFSETITIQSSHKSKDIEKKSESARPKSSIVSSDGKAKSPGNVKSPKGPGRPPGRPPKSPGRPPIKRSPGRPPMQRSPGRPPLSRSPGRSPFQRSPGRPPLHKSPSRPHSGRSPGRPPKSPRGRPRTFVPPMVRTNPPADIDKIERSILDRISPQPHITEEEVKDIPSTPTGDQPMDLTLPPKASDIAVNEVVVKTEDPDDNSLDESKLVIAADHPSRPRGRPPISPEKKMARLAAIDDIIQSVIDKSANSNSPGNKGHVKSAVTEEYESKTEVKQENKEMSKGGESFDAYVTNVDLEDVQTEVISEVTVKTESDDNTSIGNITLPSGEKLPPMPPSLYGSAQKRPKGRPKGSTGKKKVTPSKEKTKLKPGVLSETISQVNIVENSPTTVKSEPSSADKKPLDPWLAAMTAAGLTVSVRPPDQANEDTMPATVDMDVAETVEVGGDSVENKKEPTELRLEPHVVKKDSGETSKEGKVKEKSEKSDKSEKSKDHKKKKEKKKKNKNKDRDKEKDKSKKEKNRDEYYPKIKIKLGGPSKTCESVIMSPRSDASPAQSPRQEGLKLVIKTLPQMSSSESKPASPTVVSFKKEPKSKSDKYRPGLTVDDGPPILTPEPPKTATPPPPVLKVPSPVPHKNPNTLSIPQLPKGVVPSPPPPNISQPSTSGARRHYPSPAPTEPKFSPANIHFTPPASPNHPESPIQQINSPHSDTPSTSPYHSPSPSPGPSQPQDLPPMPPPSIIPPPPPPSKPAVARTVVAETIGTFIVSEENVLQDATGQKVWICPTCKMPDDGSPMIGCDMCDDWYHWVCVGIKEDPPEDQQWYCSKCLAPQKKSSKRGRKKGSGVGRGRGKKLL